MNYRFPRALLTPAMMAFAAPAWAQTNAPAAPAAGEASSPDQQNILTEIVVTAARRREESAQSAPVAVSVVSPKLIESVHATNIADLSTVVPNVQIGTLPSSPGLAAIGLRGFTTKSDDISVEPAIAVYVDGVYQSLVTSSLIDLFDLERIEVLRGPQGTLLGKNAPAGAILINRTRPKNEFGGKAQIEYGSYGLVQAQGLVTGPLIADKLSAKLYGTFRRRGNWVDNLSVPGGDLGGEKSYTVRGALLFTPTDDLEIYLSGDRYWDRGQPGPLRNISGPTSLSCTIYNQCAPHADRYDVSNAGYLAKPRQNDVNVTNNISWKGDPFTISSVTGYKKYSRYNETDLDQTLAPILEVSAILKSRQISQELRINSTKGGLLTFGDRFDWLVGFYYNHSNSRAVQSTRVLGPSSSAQSQQSIKDTKAAFAQGQFDISDALNISFGVRHSWDKTRHGYSNFYPSTLPVAGFPPIDFHQSGKWGNTSFEAGAQYKFDASKMVYFRYSEGYRGGGFVGLPASADSAREFDPETSASYEIGAKTDWFDRRLRLNLTLFHTKFDNLQRDTVEPGPNGFVLATRNAATAVTQGAELEMIAVPVPDLTLRFNAGYLDAKYKRFFADLLSTGTPMDFSYLKLIFAPKWTLSGGMEYKFDLGAAGLLGFHSGAFGVNADWRSTFELSNLNVDAGHQPGYANVNISQSFSTDNGVSVEFYVNDLFDKRWRTYGEAIDPLLRFRADNIGRTIGGVVKVQF